MDCLLSIPYVLPRGNTVFTMYVNKFRVASFFISVSWSSSRLFPSACYWRIRQREREKRRTYPRRLGRKGGVKQSLSP